MWSGALPAVILASLLPAPALVFGAPPDTLAAAPENGTGYWGPFPAPSDSVTASFHTRSDPWWFYPVRVPYYVVVWPLGLVFDGVGLGVKELDHHGVADQVATLFNPPETRFRVGASVTFSGLDGFGGGLKLLDTAFLGPRNQAELNVAGTARGKTKLTLGTRLALDARSAVEVGGGFRQRMRARYFGIGPGSVKTPQSYYRQTTTWGGAEFSRALGERTTAGIRAVFTSVDTGEPRVEDAAQSISAVYPGDVADPAFGFDRRSEGLGAGISLVYDSTTETGRPQGGGRYVLAGQRFEGTDGWTPGYFSAHVGAERFVRLWAPYRVLAVRALWGGVTGFDGPVPFQRLYINDSQDELRGYKSFRWRDRNLATLSTEFRWPIWSGDDTAGPGLDAVLLGDVGQVFERIDQFTWNTLATSAGFGFRFVGTGNFLARFEVAFSKEETEVQLTFDQVFQQDRDAILHGRNPVPLR